MPTTIHCAGCGSVYNVPDSLIGKQIRCKSCTHVIFVGAPDHQTAVSEAPLAPRRRRLRPDYEEEAPIRRRRSRDNQPAMFALLIGGIVGGGVLLGLAFIGVWWTFSKAAPADAGETVSVSPSAQTVNPAASPQANTPPDLGNPFPQGVPFPAAGAMPNERPNPPQPPANPGGGGPSVQLSNARVSGIGARIQVEVDYRVSSGVIGANYYLIVKPMRLGFHQTIYSARLTESVGRSQGTVVASGLTFGIESGPFDIWMEERGPSGFAAGFGEPERQTISNVVRVQTKDLALPGPMRRPAMPGMPRPGFPFGPRRRQ